MCFSLSGANRCSYLVLLEEYSFKLAANPTEDSPSHYFRMDLLLPMLSLTVSRAWLQPSIRINFF